ncbi:helix-turn-helix domain-containing protein [Nocardiopsis suaedae]|uniref:Helix-turn-helix transcriptional regulator n=1 Tax=Nocardiopsis suaedae TaxID=3018444 RepID=A0ABT4TEV0_9ACTN|nr:helix-turn-helix transcriptional regulator [Nocardiopsis suaedae]MDA2803228.1 helix-turn-helix transcriptional regulator [Nocardiopsis suaedae]
MTDDHGPTVRHRRLSNELKRLREAAGLDTLDVAQALGWDRSKVNRIERSQWKRLKEADIRGLCGLYEVTDEGRVAALVAMSKQAKEQGWWVRYHDVLGPGSYVNLESQACAIRFFGALIIPGLLQTPAYARALIRSGGITEPSEVKRRVEARMARQELLNRPDRPRVSAIIDEAALRKLVGGALTMREQLLHLMLFNEEGTAEVRIVPDSVGGHPGVTGQFALLDFAAAEQSTVVFIDISRDGIFMEEPEEVGRYEAKYEGLASLALSPEETNDRLTQLVDEMRGR